MFISPPTGQLAEAHASLARGDGTRARRLLAPFSNSGHVEVEVLIARSWFAEGRPHEAVGPLEVAVRLAPNHAAIHEALGVALLQSGRAREATEVLRRAVRLDPRLVSIWINLGVAAERCGANGLARQALERALTLEPRSASARFNLGVVLERLNEPLGAQEQYRQVLELAPAHVGATLNLALLAHRRLDLKSAESILRAGLAQTPDDPLLYGALANCLEDLGRFQEARAAFAKAVALAPDDVGARLNLALCRLALEEWPDAWSDYPARLAFAPIAAPPKDVPLWSGATLGAGHLLVIAEQGSGDTLQFCRFGYELAALGLRAHLACDARLVRIVSTAGAFESVLPTSAIPLDRAQAWVPLMSLPGLLRTTLQTLPARVKYLAADEGLVMQWRVRLESACRETGSNPLRIGIAWQGNPAAEQLTATRGRSPPLVAFAPLAELSNVVLVPLQCGAGAEQVADVEFRSRMVLVNVDLDTGPDAFADTAALMMSLDLIVTSDTAIAHLAGALGRPTWVVLKFVPDWRWLRDRTDCPWYPSVRLFRQPRPGDWATVFADVATAVAELTAPDSERKI